MELRKSNLLLFTRTMCMGGTEKVVLQLCEILKPYVNKIVVCSCGGVNVNKLEEMQIKHYTVPDIENKSLSVIIETFKILHQIVSKEEITIIHTHHRMAAFYTAIYNKYGKCKIINTSHNTFHDKKLMTSWIYKRFKIVACGEIVRNNLVNFYGVEKSKIEVIHNAVKSFDENVTIDATIKRFRDEGYYIVGNIGRLTEQKGMEYYISAIPEILKKHKKTLFVLVGDGENEEKLKGLVKELEVCDNVLFMGYRSDVQNIMKQLDLVVLSSLWEGLPLTPIEAFSVGKTIIATAVDGTVEVVSDNYNGCLIDAGNVDQLVSKIVFLIENPDQQKYYEENAKITYLSKFTFDSFAQKYIRYYKSIV